MQLLGSHLRPLSFLSVPPYFGLVPIKSIISGMQLANIACGGGHTRGRFRMVVMVVVVVVVVRVIFSKFVIAIFSVCKSILVHARNFSQRVGGFRSSNIVVTHRINMAI